MKYTSAFFLLTTLSLALTTSGFGQNSTSVPTDDTELSSRVTILVYQIATSNAVHAAHVGIAGTTSEQFRRYVDLKKHASIKELVALAVHSNAAVRVYSYWALLDKNYNDIDSITKRLKEDKEKVAYMSGCLMREEAVNKLIKEAPTSSPLSLKPTLKISGITQF